MRVLHIIKDLEPGGIQYLLLDMLTNNHLFDGELALFTMGKGRLLPQFRKISGIKIYEYHRKRRIDFKIVSAIKNATNDFKADVVHTHHSAEMLHTWLALRNSAHIGKAHTFHVSPALHTRADRFIYLRLQKRFDLLLTPSKALQDEMARSGFETSTACQVIYNGIDAKRVKNRLPKSDCRKALGLPEDGYIIGMAGSFYNNIRDQETLCRATPLLKETEKPVYVAFAGAGESDYFRKANYYEKCKAICKDLNIENKVYFLGNVEPVSTFFGALDVYVHFSKRDTFGLAPVEALFNNLPVVVNDLDVFREILGGISEIIFFRTSDPGDLAYTILYLLKEKIKKDREPGNDLLLQMYGIEEFLRNIHTGYLSVNRKLNGL